MAIATAQELETLNEFSARAMGFVDFPSNSIEQGSIWHIDADKAPFGPRMSKGSWSPTHDSHQAMKLMNRFHFTVRCSETCSFCWVNTEKFFSCRHEGDDTSKGFATREVIVRAAAYLYAHEQSLKNEIGAKS